MKVRGISGYFLMPLGRIVHRPLLYLIKLLGYAQVCEVKRGGLRYRVDLNEAIDLSIFLTGKLEPAVHAALKRLIRVGDHVADIGANIGAHTLHLAQTVGPLGCVYAFEPTDYAFNKLSSNLSLNPELQERIKLLNIGLTDESNPTLPEYISSSWDLTLPRGESNPLDLGFGHSTKNAAVLTFDRWAQKNAIQKLDGIKIDVDGFEVRILRGAVETLRRFKPFILMEWAPHHFTNPSEPFREMLDILKALDYEFFGLDGKPIKLNHSEIEKRIPRGVLYNAVALPAQTH